MCDTTVSVSDYDCARGSATLLFTISHPAVLFFPPAWPRLSPPLLRRSMDLYVTLDIPPTNHFCRIVET